MHKRPPGYRATRISFTVQVPIGTPIVVFPLFVCLSGILPFSERTSQYQSTSLRASSKTRRSRLGRLRLDDVLAAARAPIVEECADCARTLCRREHARPGWASFVVVTPPEGVRGFPMELLLSLFALVAGLLLVAAAFIYLVDPRQPQRDQSPKALASVERRNLHTGLPIHNGLALGRKPARNRIWRSRRRRNSTTTTAGTC